MQKPDYIELKFPADLKDFRSLSKKYMIALEGQDICIRFSQERYRKEFKYRVISAKAEEWIIARTGEKFYDFKVKLLKINTKK